MAAETQTIGLWSVMSGLAYLKGSTQILICDGQSLSLIAGISQRPENLTSVHIDPQGVLMTNGLKLTTGQTSYLQGPGTGTLDTAIPATGYQSAISDSGTYWTMAFWISIALRKWRERLSVPNPRILTGTTGTTGEKVEAFDSDFPTVTGTQGTRIIENMTYWLSESRRVLGADFTRAPYDIFIQGEADRNLSEIDYYNQFMLTRHDRAQAISEITGEPPIPCTTQIGSYVISTNPDDYGVKIAQVQATIDLGGIVLPPWYPLPVIDNVHPDVTDSKGMADLIGYYLARHEANAAIPAFIPTATRNGNQIVLDYAKGLGAGEFLAWDSGSKYADHGGSPANRGFEVTGASITDVSLAQNQRAVIVDCSAPATGWSYAMQVGDTTANQSGGKNYGPHRGLLRKGHRLDSVLNPGTSLFEWALSWRGAFA